MQRDGIERNNMDAKNEKLIYAIEHLLCPECCNEIKSEEGDIPANDKWHCPKCGWSVPRWDWEETRDEENLEEGCKREE